MYRLHPVLQPRWTWKYVLCSAAVTYVTYCWLFSMPLFAHNLPRYTGPYPVGAIDVEAPLESPRVVNEAKLKETGECVFKVETVLFTLYYPATSAKSKRAKHHWVPKPLSLTAEGYARLAHINNYFTNTLFTGAMGALVGSVTIPAKVDVPLATAATGVERNTDSQTFVSNTQGYPVIVFSHGMASSRTDYTHYFGELASRGYVVAAIEHRDGSSPGSLVHVGKSKHFSKLHSRRVLHFSLSDITSKVEMSIPEFKETQLSFREAEIEETVRVLKLINSGDGQSVFATNARGEGHGLSNWTNRLDTTNMILAGHSYGATGALRTLRGGPTPARPFTAAIILDPGKSSGPLNADVRVPTLIVHSNSWSATHSIFMGRPHFDVVRDVAKGINERGIPAWFVTSLGTSHMSVTDAPLIEPLLLGWTTGASIDVVEGVRQYVHVSADFGRFVRDGKREGLLREVAAYPDYGVDNSKTVDGFRKYWQVHVAPMEDVILGKKKWVA